MPVYEFSCPVHGKFEQYRPMVRSGEVQTCPECGVVSDRLFSVLNIKIVNKVRQRYGEGSYGKMLTHKETGGLDIFVPSFGAMEQEEVDDIAEGALEKEKARVKKNKKTDRSENQARIKAYAELARSAKRGQRAKTIREAIKETGDKLVKVVA